MAPKEQPGLGAWEGRSRGGKKPGSFLFSYLKNKTKYQTIVLKLIYEREREREKRTALPCSHLYHTLET